MTNEFDPLLNPGGIGHQLGREAVEHIESIVEGYCECERQRIEHTNASRILALRAEMAALVEREQELRTVLCNAPILEPTPKPKRDPRRAYHWSVAVVLSVAGFIFSVIAFEPVGLGWKSYVYCLGIAVVTPFIVDKLLERYASERLIKALITVCFVAALASLVLLAIIRGDLLMHQIQDVVPAVAFDDGTENLAPPENDFYETTLPLLRLVMALLALAMEIGAGLALHDAKQQLEESTADLAAYEVLRRELGDVRGQMIARLHEINSLQNDAPIFVARFWRDFYRSMLIHTVRSTLTKLSALLLLFPCAAFGQARVNLVIAIDLSASVATMGHDDNTAFRGNVTAVSRILARVPAGSTVTVLGITDNSFTKPYILLSATVSENEGYFKERLAAGRQTLVKAWSKRSAQLEPGFQETDVLGAMQLAGQIFQGTQLDTRKVLVVLSDMVQETKDLNLRRLAHVSGKGWKPDCERKKFPASLEGVEIHVLGTELPKGQAGEWDSIKGFWETYLWGCGANLVRYSVLRDSPDVRR
jgi:hypothetical protein